MHRNEYDPYTYYNWQFLRRSPEYRRTYDEYAKLLREDEPKADSMLFDLHSRWGPKLLDAIRDPLKLF